VVFGLVVATLIASAIINNLPNSTKGTPAKLQADYQNTALTTYSFGTGPLGELRQAVWEDVYNDDFVGDWMYASALPYDKEWPQSATTWFDGYAQKIQEAAGEPSASTVAKKYPQSLSDQAFKDLYDSYEACLTQAHRYCGLVRQYQQLLLKSSAKPWTGDPSVATLVSSIDVARIMTNRLLDAIALDLQ
jgi:hypothetical protein